MHFHRQQVIDGFIADFYCADHRLVVEIDGGIHESRQEHDRLRERALEKNGLMVIRFANEDVVNDMENVVNQVMNMRRTTPSP